MPYDEMLYRLGNAAAGIEWFAVFSFVAFALVYFLAPVLGYDGQYRTMIAVSLYILLAYGLVVALQLAIQYLTFLSRSAMSSPGTGPAHLAYIFSIVKLLLFIASQGCFVFGLQSLRRSSR